MSAATRRCASALRGSFGLSSHGLQLPLCELYCGFEPQVVPKLSRLYRKLLSGQGQQVGAAPRARQALRSVTTRAETCATSRGGRYLVRCMRVSLMPMLVLNALECFAGGSAPGAVLSSTWLSLHSSARSTSDHQQHSACSKPSRSYIDRCCMNWRAIVVLYLPERNVISTRGETQSGKPLPSRRAPSKPQANRKMARMARRAVLPKVVMGVAAMGHRGTMSCRLA